jgi:ferredoxin-NADP reductase
VARAALLERLRARGPLHWKTATVREVAAESERARTLVLDVPDWPGHRAGQHVDIRLTAEDGYQAERSYSIASAPERDTVELTVELVDDGEVSAYLVGEVRVGDQFEVRGPIGWHFTWSVQDGGPLLLLAGGSGLVPLMAMLRHLAAHDAEVDVRLLLSARVWEDVLYRDELEALAARPGVTIRCTLTRTHPDGWSGFDRRVDRDMLRTVGPEAGAMPRVFVCGPTGFVEQVADELVALGHAPRAVRAERFGPTGG